MYKRIFSGIQPSGSLHLGNYFGAIRQWIQYQNQCYESENDLCIYSIVDLHSMTTVPDKATLSANVKLMCASLIGAGIDPNKCVLFRQSSVPYHGQLCWILGTLSTVQELQAFPQFREKSEKGKFTRLGLLIYPVLQVADILLYKANYVPVGDDQLPHLNFAKHLSGKFNYIYGDLFPIPELISIKSSDDFSGRIRSLRYPEKKMSKSDPDIRGKIEITDSADAILSKIKRAVTDFKSEVSFDLNARPGVSNLVMIYSLITGLTPQQVCEQSASINTGQFKLLLADLLIEYLKPIREEINRLMREDKYLSDVLINSENKAQEIAEKTMKEVYDAIGVRF